MKIFGKIWSFLLPGLLIAALLVLGVPRLFGVKMFNVISGSMTPTYKIGDLIYAVPTKAENIKEGDVITFVLGEDLKVATHRVIGIDREAQEFYTKGDANESEDGSPVIYQNIVGVVRFSIPKIGTLLESVSGGTGRIIAATALIAAVLLSTIISINSGEEAKKNKAPPVSLVESSKPVRGKEEENMTLKKQPPPGWGGGKVKSTHKSAKHGFNIIFALLLVVGVSTVGTLSYLAVQTAPATNAFGVGTTDIDIDEPGVNPQNVEWDVDTKPVKLTNPAGEKQVPGVVRAMLVPTIATAGGQTQGTLGTIQAPSGNTLVLGDFTLHFVSGWDSNWFYKDGYFYYKAVLNPGAATEQLLAGVTLTNPDKASDYQGKTVQIDVLADIIQAEGTGPAQWGVQVTGTTVSSK